MSIFPFLPSCYTLFFRQSDVGFLLTLNLPLAMHDAVSEGVPACIWRGQGIVSWLWVSGLKDYSFLLSGWCYIHGALAADYLESTIASHFLSGKG